MWRLLTVDRVDGFRELEATRNGLHQSAPRRVGRRAIRVVQRVTIWPMDADRERMLRELRAEIQDGIESELGPTLDEVRTEDIVARGLARLDRERQTRDLGDC